MLLAARLRLALGRGALALLALSGLAACRSREASPPRETPPPPDRPWLLLVTLDTTRADAVAPQGDPTVTPHLAALAARSISFAHAYATTPTTLAAHASMMSGLYPAGHGVHENGRRVPDGVPLLAERLASLGYRTAAFVSGYPLSRQFGLARGFAVYDDEFDAGRLERPAIETNRRALALLAGARPEPLFLWVHYFDPHDPYEPPEPFRSRFAADLYLGEIAAMDDAFGQLLEAFTAAAGARPWRALVLADHGEGRGEHGERFHGSLLYQGTMRVPLLVAGPGVVPAVRPDAVSIRQVHPTLLSWAGVASPGSLESPSAEAVLGEAMQPFLNYRWQPQTMAVDGRLKVIRAGRFEQYDLALDPGERQDLVPSGSPDRRLAQAALDYPLPSASRAVPSPLDDEDRKKLASLGYLTSGGAPAKVPPGAPRPAEMTRLFADLDASSRLFANEQYERAVPLLARLLAADPGNLMVAVRLAVCYGFLDRDAEALATFAQARRIDPDSLEARHYLAMHHRQKGRDTEAAVLFEAVLAGQPDRLPALEALAAIRARQGRLAEAAPLFERAAALAREPAPLLMELGHLRMAMGETEAAIGALERARAGLGERFDADLELGVLYLAARRLAEAREALDRLPSAHPERAMALFKRAQVAVLLGEPDRAERVRAAWLAADATTRPLVEREPLFAGLLPR